MTDSMLAPLSEMSRNRAWSRPKRFGALSSLLSASKKLLYEVSLSMASTMLTADWKPKLTASFLMPLCTSWL